MVSPNLRLYPNRKAQPGPKFELLNRLNLMKAIELAKKIKIGFGPAPFYHNKIYQKQGEPKQGLPNAKTELKRCPFLWEQVFIDRDGVIFPCCAPNYPRVASIGMYDFESIWNNEKYQTMRQTFVDSSGFEHCYQYATKGFLANPRS